MKKPLKAIKIFTDNPEIPILLYNGQLYNYEQFVKLINHLKIDQDLFFNDKLIDGKIVKSNINIKDVLSFKVILEFFKPFESDSIYYNENKNIIDDLYSQLLSKFKCITNQKDYLNFVLAKTTRVLQFKMKYYLDQMIEKQANLLNISLSNENKDIEKENKNKVLESLNIDSIKLNEIKNICSKNTILDKENISLVKINENIADFLDMVIYNIYDDFVSLYEKIEDNNFILESEIDSYFFQFFTNAFITIDYINEYEQ